MFKNIPEELKNFNQWVLWRLEGTQNGKATKIPYCPQTGKLASVNDSSTWATFDEAVAALSGGWYNGIGFVLTKEDPFTFIDLDYTQGDDEALQRQLKVFEEFNSYSERSPSGNGLHIIVKGSVETGRRRSFIEIYSSQRYMTVTGDVYRNAPIENRQELVTLLWSQMGGGSTATYIYEGSEEERLNDEEIINKALSAVNGEKFAKLLNGSWQEFYPSQSEADFAFINIVAFYTQNRIQIIRIFRSSALGKRPKALRNDYVDYMINKSFDRMLPPIDLDGLKAQLEAVLAAKAVKIEACPIAAPISNESVYSVPPGLLGDIARFIYTASPRPVPEIALAGAIGFMAGICGRSFNVSGTGLNQYMLLLAPTGTGKEAMASGINKLIAKTLDHVPNSNEFIGPSEIASSRALIKYFASSNIKSFVSILGEFGIFLSQMNARNTDSNMKGLRRLMLDIFNKSGHTDVLRPVIYSDKIQNVPAINSPALTLLCESTPEEFYKALDESMIAQGLIPRFSIIEYYGKRPELNPYHLTAQPDAALLTSLEDLLGHSIKLNTSNRILTVEFSLEADSMCKAFDKRCDYEINEASREVFRHLWNRAHIKVLKLAALVAVGVNPLEPVVDIGAVKWAIEIVTADIKNLIHRFEDGSANQVIDPMHNVLRVIRNAVRKFVMTDNKEIKKSRGEREAIFHAERLTPHRYIQNKTAYALRSSDLVSGLKTLIANGELIEADNKIKERLKRTYNVECFRTSLYCVDSTLFDENE